MKSEKIKVPDLALNLVNHAHHERICTIEFYLKL